MLKDFRDFIMKGNVVDMAVGIVIGLAFGALVNSFVANVIMSPMGAIFGKPNFDALALGPLKYGAFLTSLVSFLIVAGAVFFFVVKPMNGLLERMGMLEEAQPMHHCPSCLQPIPAAATKCMYCTVDVTPQT